MPDTGEAISIFAALEPDAKLTSLIQGYKDLARAVAGEQVYLSDPPHLTVYLAMFPSADSALAVWPRIVARDDDLRIALTGWHVFESDALTGSHTVVCGIAADDKARLRTMQLEVLELLGPARDRAATQELFAPRSQYLTSHERACIERHGFPYIGDGWEPHFTIASFRPSDWPKVWAALEPTPPRGSFRCRRWRLTQVVDGILRPLDGLGDWLDPPARG